MVTSRYLPYPSSPPVLALTPSSPSLPAAKKLADEPGENMGYPTR